jgi:hypothetical protein
MKNYKHAIISLMIVIGNGLTGIGCLGLILGFIGVFSFESVAFGLSSGIRIIGSIAIAGCMLSAIGHGFLDYSK